MKSRQCVVVLYLIVIVSCVADTEAVTSDPLHSPLAAPTTTYPGPAVVVDDNGTPCILAKLNMTINVNYHMLGEITPTQKSTAQFVIPKCLEPQGVCRGTKSGSITGPALVYTWNWSTLCNTTTDRHSGTNVDLVDNSVVIQLSDTTSAVQTINVNVKPDDPVFFPNAVNTEQPIKFKIDATNELGSSSDKSFKCDSLTELFADTGSVEISNLQLQADDKTVIEFSSPKLCRADVQQLGDVTPGAPIAAVACTVVVVVAGSIGSMAWRTRRNRSGM